ncbi:MAG: hypothetical protein AMJ68_01665 [Acidithiobacillales bacterium SG8_45]|nr:MAG: hypothetical protein AMJ68_01665 [Acidithiobacillales bacterium SG8_45]
MILRVGLTGGIGSGKSVVARAFADLGVPVIDADVISRNLVEPGQPALAAISEQLGSQFISAGGELDRAQLRERIFTSPAARKVLEGILHPLVHDAIQEETKRLTSPYCIVVIPLLIEASQQSLVDRILVVDASENDCIERVVLRDHTTAEAAKRILSAQLDRETRLGYADDVITNEGSLDMVAEQVARLHKRYLVLAAQSEQPQTDR